MGRAPCCDKANVKKGPWSPEEDAKLKSFIDQNGTGGNWIALPQKIGLKRCGKSCRLRWLNYLRPNIKHGGFSEEEDNIICSLYISIGSRWSIIAAQLPGRTDNDIKNYWNTRLKKKLLGRRKDHSHARRFSSFNDQNPIMKDQNGEEEEEDGNNSYVNTLSNSALERLQLHMQLQNLQSPFSFYNNPALWPKLHPLGEKMIQNHHKLNENPPSIQQVVLVPSTSTPPPQVITREKAMVYGDLPTDTRTNSENSNLNQDDLGNSLNGLSPFDQMEMSMMSKSNGTNEQLMNTNFQSVFGLEAELNELINYRKTTEFDCFGEMDHGTTTTSTSTTVNESIIWWGTNDFDTKSSSSNNSWDSASVIDHHQQNHDQGLMFQDYVLSYDDL